MARDWGANISHQLAADSTVATYRLNHDNENNNSSIAIMPNVRSAPQCLRKTRRVILTVAMGGGGNRARLWMLKFSVQTRLEVGP